MLSCEQTPCDFGFESQTECFKKGGPSKHDGLYPNGMMINTPAPFGMPALSDAAMRQIRDNVISKRFGNGSFKQLYEAVMREFPMVPDELYTVAELKDNMLFKTCASMTIERQRPSHAY